MITSPTWQKPWNRDVADEVEFLRDDTLVFLGRLTVAFYLFWHIVSILTRPLAASVAYWYLFVIVIIATLIAPHLRRLGSMAGTWWYVLSFGAAITTAIITMRFPIGTVFYPVLTLVAVVLLSPLAGLVVAVGSLSTVIALWSLGPLAYVEPDCIGELAVALLFTLLVSWVLSRNLLTVVGWSLQSYELARTQADEARTHRAQLVQALKQLDIAYYRLERANAALELAWRAAETAERSKSDFVTSISHELRTPLNLIVGFAEMMTIRPESYGMPLPPPYRRDMFAVYRNAQHLLTLTNDVIDLARVGIGRISLSREPVHLRSIVDEGCEIVREYLAAKGLSLKTDISAQLPVVSVDPLRVRQVLLNLLTNAARFTERGGITVRVSVEDQSITVEVADTGRGISPEELPRVFEEYYHGGDRTFRPIGELGGSGLGLPISKRLIELHGGQMGVRSTLGAGTTFWFTLPASQGNLIFTTGTRGKRSELADTTEKVLVLISADLEFAAFLRRHLRGCRLVIARDFPDAVATSVELRASAIIVDADEAHEDVCQSAPVPVIRLPLPRPERIAASLGANAYLTKPMSESQLRRAIESIAASVRTILVVDDDPDFAHLVERMLLGGADAPRFDVSRAGNGREALTVMRQRRPDLVLLDLMMPEMDGASLMAEMSSSEDLKSVPIVIISAHEKDEEGVSLKGEVSVAKSEGFGLEELLAVIEALLGALDPPRTYLRREVARAG